MQYTPTDYTGNKFIGTYSKLVGLQNMLFYEQNVKYIDALNAKYKAELDILLDHPVGYQGEILNVMMDNLEQIARYEEHLTVLDKHFKD